MIPTRNSIAGEVFSVTKGFYTPYKKHYTKMFNDKQFVVKVARQLERQYPEYKVTLSENETEYILRVKEYDKDDKG